MNKQDFSLLSEFTFSVLGVDTDVIGLLHSKCKSHIKVEISAATTMAGFVRKLIKHNKEDCKHLQRLKSTITIFDEVDNG